MLQRDLDIKGQLETLTSRLSGKIRNVTCVMQELGYVSIILSVSLNQVLETSNSQLLTQMLLKYHKNLYLYLTALVNAFNIDIDLCLEPDSLL